MEIRRIFKQKVVLFCAVIAVFAYAFYHIVSLFDEDITTVVTGVTTEKTYLEAGGYIFRDETVLTSENIGMADLKVADGTKVTAGQTLATVYSNEATAGEELLLDFTDKHIAVLEKSLEAGHSVADIPGVNREISDAYYSITRLLASNDAIGLTSTLEKLCTSLASLEILSNGDESKVSATLDTLRAARDELLAGGGEGKDECSDVGGYFYSDIDGYESSFTLRAADELTADGFDKLAEEVISSPEIPDGAYGKLAETSEWKFAMKITEAEGVYFELGAVYDVAFTENGGRVIPMALEAMTLYEDDGEIILVFSTDRLPAGFVFSRAQSVKLEVNSISGIYVPRDAVYKDGGELGVYVMKGNVVRYRAIRVIYETKEYYLVDPNVEDEEGKEYLGINEQLILGGKNLFDGRVFD